MGMVAGGPGFKTAERVAAGIRKHALLSDGDAVVVALSGGADSTCLLHLLARLEMDLDILVAHVDHGLSETSSEVAARVAREAAEAGFDVHVVRAADLAGPNLQERAREFRYAFFDSLAEQEGARAIATGHTLDDRVETTLARLVHGSGSDGLAGIRPRAGRRIHPLLPLRRSETRAYCEEVGATFFDDPANEDPRYERTIVRTKLVPVLEARWGDGGIRAVASSIDRVTEDADALAAQGATLFTGLAQGDEEGTYRFDLVTLQRLPRALQRRVLELAVGRVRDRAGGIGEVLDALERQERKPDARFALVGGGEIVVTADEVIVTVPQTLPEKRK